MGPFVLHPMKGNLIAHIDGRPVYPAGDELERYEFGGVRAVDGLRELLVVADSPDTIRDILTGHPPERWEFAFDEFTLLNPSTKRPWRWDVVSDAEVYVVSRTTLSEAAKAFYGDDPAD